MRDSMSMSKSMSVSVCGIRGARSHKSTKRGGHIPWDSFPDPSRYEPVPSILGCTYPIPRRIISDSI